MRLLRRPGLIGPLLIILGFWLSATAFAQSALNSAMSLGLLHSLSQAQQQAIMSRLGEGVGGLSGYSGLSGLGIQDFSCQTQLTQPQQFQQQEAVQKKHLELLRQKAMLALKGGDCVVVDTGFHLAPRPAGRSQFALLRQAYAAHGLSQTQRASALSALGGGSATATAALTSHADVAKGSANEPSLNPKGSRMSPGQQDRIKVMVLAIRGHNPYQFSPNGEFYLRGFAPINVLPPTGDQATLRLSVVSAFGIARPSSRIES